MFSVKLANSEMFTASEESTVKCLDRLDFRRSPGPVFDPSRRGRVRVRVWGGGGGSFSRTAADNRAKCLEGFSEIFGNKLS